MNSIFRQQFEKESDHSVPGIKNPDQEKKTEAINDPFISLLAFKKLRLFLQGTYHDDGVDNQGEDRHRNHKPIEFTAHIETIV